MKIKVKLFNHKCAFETIRKGDWIDLKASTTVSLESPYALPLSKGRDKRYVVFDSEMIPLGIGMQLPKGYEAVVNSRSSTFNTFGIVMQNGQGVIDHTYSGPDDQWNYPAIALKEGRIIFEGDRICQFKIQLSQKANIWQKIKWLFTSKIEFEFVDDYKGVNRGGLGSTGVK